MEVRPPGRPRLPGTVWLQTVAPVEAVRAGADLFHGPLGILPLASPLPGVATVHDLTPLLFPEWHDRKNVAGFAPFLPATVRRAARLVCVSRATRDDLLLACPGGRREGVRRPERPRPRRRTPRRRRLLTRARTSSPSAPSSRGRTTSGSSRAMEAIWDRRPDFPDLVLAGGSGLGDARTSTRGSPGRGTRPGSSGSAGCRPSGRPRSCAGARLLAYPSLYEGFGLPPSRRWPRGSRSSRPPRRLSRRSSATRASSRTRTTRTRSQRPSRRANDDEAFRAGCSPAAARERASLFTWESAARRDAGPLRRGARVKRLRVTLDARKLRDFGIGTYVRGLLGAAAAAGETRPRRARQARRRGPPPADGSRRSAATRAGYSVSELVAVRRALARARVRRLPRPALRRPALPAARPRS